MATKTPRNDPDPREVNTRLNQLYLRRTILNDVISNLERYQIWLGRASGGGRRKSARCRRAA